MDVTTALFFLFSAVLLFAAFRVITARNPVHAVLFLVLTFFQAAMIWMLLKAEFLSLSLVLVRRFMQVEGQKKGRRLRLMRQQKL